MLKCFPFIFIKTGVKSGAGLWKRKVNTMTVSAKALGIDRLNIDDRLALVEEIWAGICADSASFPLTEAQRAELDRRVADDESFPDDVIPWEDIKASMRARLSR